MIDELCDTPEKHQFLHVGGGFAVIYGPDGAPLAQAAAARPGRPALRRHRPRHDFGRQSGGRSGRTLCAPGRDAACCSTIVPATGWRHLRCRSTHEAEAETREAAAQIADRWPPSRLRKRRPSKPAMESRNPSASSGHAHPPSAQCPTTTSRLIQSFVARHRPAVRTSGDGLFRRPASRRRAAGGERGARLDRRAHSLRANGPRHWDRAAYIDEAGYTNVVSVAYWDERNAFEAWFPAVRERMDRLRRCSFAGLGTFIEVLSPSVNDYETLFSSLGRPEGVAVLADDLSGEIMEHAYWGGMRDRIPASQTSELAPAGSPSLVRDGARVRVKPHDNICSDPFGPGLERHRSRRAQNVSRRRRAGVCAPAWISCATTACSIGCFANRYMTVLDRERTTDRKKLRHELVEKSRRARALGRIASDPRAHFRRGDEISFDSRPGREAPALSRSDGGAAPPISSSNIGTATTRPACSRRSLARPH